jgi:hypothetical protein
LKRITGSTVREKKRLQGIVRTVVSNKAAWKDNTKKNYISTNKNGSRGDVSGGVNSGNSCCPSLQNISSSSLLPESVRIKIH